MAVTYTSRDYRAGDLARVVALLETRLAAGLHWNLSVGDLRQVLPREESEAERYARVWEDGHGGLVGFGLVWVPWDTVQVLLHPAHDPERRAPALCEAILAWAERRAGALSRERGKPVRLRVRVREGDAGTIAVLERHRFDREEAHTVSYRRSLAVPFDSPALPPGFVIRHVRGEEEEVAAYVALHREAFGTQHMRAASRLALMRDPGYIAELDLVAEAPDGTLAAFVVAEILREESLVAGQTIGSTDPVGTRPAYRRLGLARALLLEAFRRLRERSVERVTVSTGSWNGAMQRVLEAVGYEVSHRTLAFVKDVP